MKIQRGHIRLQRGWLDHPMFGRQPFCKRAAWAWLLEQASWKPRKTSIRDQVILLRRGQLVASQRYCATAWKWNRGKVQRFLKTLQSAGAIEPTIVCGETVITICNYDKYQAEPNHTDPAIDPKLNHSLNKTRSSNRSTVAAADCGLAPDGDPLTEPTASHRQAQIRKKDKEDNKNAAPSGSASADCEIELFERGKIILGYSAGGLIAKLLRVKNGNIPLARAGARNGEH